MKRKRRLDLGGCFFRSAWEANWARYLTFLQKHGEIAGWEYEVVEFEFPVERGARFYKPDFQVLQKDGSVEYHEVKGWMDSVSATRLKRMAKYYPHVIVRLIDGKVYRAVAKKMARVIPGWE